MIKLKDQNLAHLGLFRWKKIGKLYLFTNDVGEYIFLNPAEFDALLGGRLPRDSLAWRLLDEKNFIDSPRNREELVKLFRCKFRHVQNGTSLHIVIPTLRCNQCCVYCHAKARSVRAHGYDMDKKTAQKVVDAVFESPNKHITIEFQGGEPLLNWDIVRFIILRARSKALLSKRSLNIIMVSNLTLMNEERLRFLVKHRVQMCTSLDGPRAIHDKNRPISKGGSAYERVTYWIKRIAQISPKYINALITLPRSSLDYPREIVDEYIKWRFLNIPLRPVSVLGYAGEREQELGAPVEQFLSFYRKALDYIIELNEITKEVIRERMAYVCLCKILTPHDPSYLDMRSPCGAGCGQLAYFCNGDVYTCDEARMLGDEAFKLGNVKENSYAELMNNQRMGAVVMASCIDGLYCDYCVYKPYCGVCPVVNWKEHGTLYAQPSGSRICKINQGILGYLFEALQDKRKKNILRSWI